MMEHVCIKINVVVLVCLQIVVPIILKKTYNQICPIALVNIHRGTVYHLRQLVFGAINRRIKEKTMNDQRIYKWLPKFVRVENELNKLLAEAAKDGVKPAIRIYENEELLGKGVQLVEVSLVRGTMEK